MLSSLVVRTKFFSFFFSSRRRHTRSLRDWSSDVCSSDLILSCGGRHRLHHDGAFADGGESLAGLQDDVGGSAGLRKPQPSLAAVNAHAAHVAGDATERMGVEGQFDGALRWTGPRM